MSWHHALCVGTYGNQRSHSAAQRYRQKNVPVFVSYIPRDSASKKQMLRGLKETTKMSHTVEPGLLLSEEDTQIMTFSATEQLAT